MRVLFIGDIFGDIGRRVLSENLSSLREEYAIDVVVANGENCAAGRGITLPMARKLRKYGVNIITGGNHSHSHMEPFADPVWSKIVLHPENVFLYTSGTGVTTYTLDDGRILGVVNLLGKTWTGIKKMDCPFKVANTSLEKLKETTKCILVDFHAEATSEKVCLAHYLDGRVSAVLGTHTHVQTADHRIFPKGTGFMTDVGMTGAEFSAIGMEHEPIIDRILHNKNTPFVQSRRDPMINAVVLDIDDESGQTKEMIPLYRRYANVASE